MGGNCTRVKVIFRVTGLSYWYILKPLCVGYQFKIENTKIMQIVAFTGQFYRAGLLPVIIGLTLFFYVGCSTETEQLTLSEEQMSTIMSEIAIAEGSTTMLAGYKRDSLSSAYFKMVFDIQHTTLPEYERNLRIAVKDVERMRRIMQGAEQRILDKKGPQTDKK